MNAPSARMEFAPPPTPGLLRAMVLAILAHGLLLVVLTMGVQWKRDTTPVTVEAELWSALPIQAAPRAPEPAPVPPPEPEPKAVKQPPTPVAKALPDVPDPSIAIAKEKAKLQKERQQQQERLEHEKRQKDAIKAKQLKEEKAAKEARETELREKLAHEKKLQLQEQQKTQAAKADADAKKVAELRKQQIERMNRMADQATGSGDANSLGSAKKSSGPSATYAGRIVARIKPNITYTETITGNPVADVEVRTSPDGTIISRKLVKSSGVKSWDDAVINAIDKTEKLPPDVDGRVIPQLTLGFRPRD